MVLLPYHPYMSWASIHVSALDIYMVRPTGLVELLSLYMILPDLMIECQPTLTSTEAVGSTSWLCTLMPIIPINNSVKSTSWDTRWVSAVCTKACSSDRAA